MNSSRPKRAQVVGLDLSPEESFVLARANGQLSIDDLAAMTGLDAPKVEQIVTKLVSKGALVLEEGESSGYLPDVGSEPALPDEGEASLADFAAALGLDPSIFVASTAAQINERPVDEARVETKSNRPPPDLGPDPQPELEELGPGDDGEAGEGEAGEGEAASRPVAEPVNEEVEANERNYRQLYETKFRPLPTDARVQAAQTAGGADLFALCFDADPRVVGAILENPQSRLDHVRLLAFHHRTGTGLEMLSRRQEFLRDVLVERRLLRNPQCGEMTLNRIVASKRLQQTYKIVIDRDVPDLTRAKSRGHLRQKWATAPPEERSDLVLRTEARCLAYMTGCTFDAKTTGLLSGKQVYTVLFIQNIAKFAAAPPGLLAHLVKLPFVKKNPSIKKLLLQHPNMPGEAKRQI